MQRRTADEKHAETLSRPTETNKIIIISYCLEIGTTVNVAVTKFHRKRKYTHDSYALRNSLNHRKEICYESDIKHESQTIIVCKSSVVQVMLDNN